MTVYVDEAAIKAEVFNEATGKVLNAVWYHTEYTVSTDVSATGQVTQAVHCNECEPPSRR